MDDGSGGEERKIAGLILGSLVFFSFLILADSHEPALLALRIIFGSVFLVFVPGYLILRTLKVGGLSATEFILYSAGLSMSYLMVLGLFADLFYPLMGLQRPMSALLLLAGLVVSVIVLLIASLVRGGGQVYHLDLGDLPALRSHILFLIFLPIFSILSVYFVDYFGNDVPIIIMLLLVAAVPVLIAYDVIPVKAHGAAIFSASLAILLHTNLMSGYIWGWDINFEYYFASLVQAGASWNPLLPYPPNGLLSIVVLAPIYSALTGLNLIWVFKSIFPVLVSLIPVGMFLLFRDQFGEGKVAALAPFTFMFYYGFFKDMADKQLLAEFFLIMLLLLLLRKNIHSVGGKIMLIIFSFSVVVSHYGISYVFIIVFVAVSVLMLAFRRYVPAGEMRPNFAVFFFVLAIGWFLFVSRGTSFNNIVYIGERMASNIFDLLKSPEMRSGMSYALMPMPTDLWRIYLTMHYVLQLFISAGILALAVSVYKRKPICASIEFAFFSMSFFAFLLMQVVFTMSLGMDRVLQMTLLLLSPYAVIGCQQVMNLSGRIVRRTPSVQDTFVVFSLFLAIFLLFNAGSIFRMFDDPYPAFFTFDKDIGYPIFEPSEISGATWLAEHANSSIVYTQGKGKRMSYREGLLLSGYFLYDDVLLYSFNTNTTRALPYSYVFLGRFSAQDGVIFRKQSFGFNFVRAKMENTTFYRTVLAKSGSVYDSGGSMVYVTP